MQKIPLSKCFVDQEIKDAVNRAIDSGMYILGKECQAFEEELARHTGVKHCVLGTSWTMIVYMLHKAMGMKAGDEVIVPSHTAFPTMEPLIHCGATPVFSDINENYVMDVEKLEALITPRTVGIIPVHIYGHPVDMDRVMEIAAKHKIWVIEDCAQAQGAKYKGKTVGSMGHFGAYSFFPSKNLTILGDGGALMTNDSDLAEQVRKWRNHGRKDKYTHDFAGYNVRFNEIHAAIGRVMLKHLDQFNAHRREIAKRYTEGLSDVVKTPPIQSYAEPVYHMYVIQTPNRDALQKHLKDRGVETGIHYPIANHEQPAILSRFPKASLPRTEAVVKDILSLPIYGDMPLEYTKQVIAAVREFFGK